MRFLMPSEKIAKKDKENSTNQIKKKGGKRPAEITFPRETLEKALRVAKAIDESNAGRPFDIILRQ